MYRHRVQRAEDAINRMGADHGAGARREQVRLTRLDSGKYPQVRKPLPAFLDRREVAGNVQGPDPASMPGLDAMRRRRGLPGPTG